MSAALLRRSAALFASASLVLAACSTGVRDEEGWQKVLERDYQCEELLDVARDLPESFDRKQINHDLRRRGCPAIPTS